jgi:uncharacterized protein YndB with AHSA1/START domain
MDAEIVNINPELEIVSVRHVAFAIGLVYTAWTDPSYLKNWWGPAGFTNTFKEFDLRPGGKWSFIMHGPQKGNYVNECVFTEVQPPNLIAWKRISQPLFNVVVTFDQLTTSSTRILYRMIFDSKENCDKVKSFAGDKNQEVFDKLEAELSTMTG